MNRSTGYSRHTILSVVRIALVALLVHMIVVFVAEWFTKMPTNHASYWWCLAWLEAAVFSYINVKEARNDWKAANYSQRRLKTRSLVPAAGWFLKIDSFALAVSSLMTLAGYIAIFIRATPVVIWLLLISGMIFAFWQASNRADRMRINRIIHEDNEYAKQRREAIKG